MKIHLLSDNPIMEICWLAYFRGIPDVTVTCDRLEHFIANNKVDCVVSPANSYGLMDGGFDLAITTVFGEDLQKRVQEYIIKNYKGEQPVATSFIIDTCKDNIKLIHTPTMRVPFPVKDPMIVYQCMRTTLMTVLDNNIEMPVIPAFCGEYGNVNPKVIAKLMYEAYMQVMNPPSSMDWDYPYRWYPELEYALESWTKDPI